MAEPSAARGRQLLWIVCAATIAVVVAALAQGGWLLTNDGPQHLLNTFISLHYTDSPLRWDETWLINEPLTVHGYKEAFSALEPLLGWRRAHWFAVCIPAPIGIIGWTLLVDRLGAYGRWPVIPLLGALSISWPFWIGLVPFLYSAAITPFIFYFAAASAPDGKPVLDGKSAFVISMLLLGQAHMHPFPTMLTGLMLAGWVGPRHIVKLAVIGLPAVLFCLWVRLASTTTGETADVFGVDATGPLPFIIEPLVCQIIVFALILWSAWQMGLRRRWWLLAVCFLFVLTGYLLPDTVGGWGLVKPRFHVMAVPLLVACAPLELLTQLARRVVVAVLLVVSSWSIVDDVQRVRQIESDFAPIVTLLETALPDLTLKTWDLELSLGPTTAYDVLYLSPGLHLGQIAAITRGGAPTWTQEGDATLHTLLRSIPRPRPSWVVDLAPVGAFSSLWRYEWRFPVVLREAVLASVLPRLQKSDLLFLIGAPGDASALRRGGYHVDVLGESPDGTYALLQATFEGCTVDVDVSSAGGGAVLLGIEFQKNGLEVIPASAGDETFRFEEMPCGSYRAWPCESDIREASARHVRLRCVVPLEAP